MISRPKSVFKDQEAVKCLSSLHDRYVIVPADKTSNNIVLFPIDVLRFSEFSTMRNHLSGTLMLNDYMSRWDVLKRRVGAVTSQRVLKVLFYVNILQCFFVVENFTANVVISAFGLDKGGVDPFSPKYRLSSIICDVASFRLFKPVRSEPLHDNNRKFLHIPFANKGIDAINISNSKRFLYIRK
jgi:hypothetical protein